MNTNYEIERVVDFKDLLYRTAKKWRKIISGAIIIALLAALNQVVSGVVMMINKEKLAEAEEKYQIAVADFEATGERLKTSIENLRAQSDNQQEYNNNSELMRIDPMSKWIGSFQIYIDSKYQIDPSLTYQNVDPTNRLISAYSNYLRSGELYNEMLDELDTVDEIRFLEEIYSVSADPETSTLTVHCIGNSEADVQKILAFAKNKVAERFETIRNAIGEHSYEVMTESVYSTIDLDLDARQKANLLAITDYASEIGKKSEELTEWEEEKPPKPEYGARYTTKQAIKFLILGGIVGLIVMWCYYVAKYVISSTVKTEEDWRAFGIPVLGCIKTDECIPNFKWIDLMVDRAFGRERNTSTDQDCSLAAHRISAMLQKQGIGEATFIGGIDRPIAEDFVRKMETAVPEVRFVYAGDVLSEPETPMNLARAENIILLENNQTTPLKSINQTLTLLKVWNKNAIGAVVID